MLLILSSFIIYKLYKSCITCKVLLVPICEAVISIIIISISIDDKQVSYGVCLTGLLINVATSKLS